MNTVGLIVNPKAGKDIRRIVSYGRFTTDEEKLNIVARILTGLTDSGVDRVLAKPDTIGLIKAAINNNAYIVSITGSSNKNWILKKSIILLSHLIVQKIVMY